MNWDFLGKEAGDILRQADRLRRARERAERALRSGDEKAMKAALKALENISKSG